MPRIVITGPESTGKSELTRLLANHFNGIAVPEYAREYVTSLRRPYTKEDILHIARYQAAQFEKYKEEKRIVFFDTGLIITRVWLEVVGKSAADWIDDCIAQYPPDHCLLCYPDIPWEPDPLRENGGEMRKILYDKYLKIIESFRLPYAVIEGVGDARLNKAIDAVDRIFNRK